MKLLVVGCPRGGTSMVAGFLKSIGLRTVEDGRSSRDYPDGYSEPLGLLAFTKACEKFRGNRYRLTDDPLIEPGLWGCSEMSIFHDEVFKPLSDENIDFIKVPDLALSIEYVLDTWPDVLIVGVWRNPYPSMQSFYEREFGRYPSFKERFYAIGIWNMFIKRMCVAREGYGNRVKIVQLEQFVEDPSEFYRWVKRYFNGAQLQKATGVFTKKPRRSAGLMWTCFPWLVEHIAQLFKLQKREFFTTSKTAKAIRSVGPII